MSGIKYLFDTNAIIGLFSGNTNLKQYLLQESKIHISVISIIEFLFYQSLTESGKDIFFEFCEQSEIINQAFDNSVLVDVIISVRKKCKLKFPDAIIVGSAITNEVILITNDAHFANIANLQTLTF